MKKIVPYEESFGAFTLPEGFSETLQGLSIEEQMGRYRLSMSRTDAMTDWRERTSGYWYVKLDAVSDVLALIVKDETLVGIMIKDHNGREVPCFADEGVCTYYDEENNGAGYKTRQDYVYLLCVPENLREQ
jgi:hypothetical protein